MTISITHRKTATLPDDPNVEINKGEWNDTHVVTGAEDASNKDASGGYPGLTLFKINFKNALNTFTSFFTNSNTASRTYTFQDRNGTIADDTDLAAKASTTSVTPIESAISASNIDWSLLLTKGGVFSKSIGSTATTFTFSNAVAGQNIIVAITATSGTVTWPTVSWSGGSTPTQTANKTDIYTFIKVGSTIYGSVVQNF